MNGSDTALKIYADNVEQLAERYESVDADAVFAPFTALLPTSPAEIVDIGAGTGRDAAWLVARGHKVTAVEPTSGLQKAGIDRHGDRIEWVSDRFPKLETLKKRTFDLVWVNAVWHHLTKSARETAMARIAQLTRLNRRALISLRQGPLPTGQPIHLMQAKKEIERARRAGFDLVERIETDSRQEQNRQAEVTWTWLVLERKGSS